MISFSCFPDHVRGLIEAGQRISNRSYRGRYAPSPTGDLHLGNLRTALVSWLRARSHGGEWLLRIDDIDTPRNRSGAVESLQRDLLWLGLKWDGPVVFQSERRGIYASALSALRRMGKIYPCRCSRRVLAKTSGQDGQHSVYQGTCRDLGLFWGWEYGRLPSWRLRVGNAFSEKCGDVILRRSDGFIAYHFATVIDELTLGITEVVRGEDLAIGLMPQLAVMDAFFQQPLRYRHVPLLLDSQGRKLAKREGSQGLEYLRAQGMTPPQVVGLLAASLGLTTRGSELTTLDLLSDLINRRSALDDLLNP